MSIDIKAISARAEAATPGPWMEQDWGVISGSVEVASFIKTEADADFISHSREDIPALLAEMERQDERIGLLSTIIDAYIEICDKNRSTIAKLMEAHHSVTAERDEARDAICRHCMDVPCREVECEWWRGAGKERNDD